MSLANMALNLSDEAAAALGLPAGAGGIAVWDRIADTQQVATAKDTEVSFFDTATSTRVANPFKAVGCTLFNSGLIPDNESWIIAAVAMSFMADDIIAEDEAEDFGKVFRGGMLLELKVNEEVRARRMRFAECAAGYGFGIGAVVGRDYDSTGAFSGVVAQTNGQTFHGRPISLVERPRFILHGGNQIKATFAHHANADLVGTAPYVCIELYGWRIPTA